MGRRDETRAHFIVLIAVALGTAACRTAAIKPIEHRTLATDADPTLEEAEQRIRAGAKARDWTISHEGPGRLAGTLYVRSHVLVVEIAHDTSHFDVRYRSSENLMDDGHGRAHRKVGAWMGLLARAISEQP